MGGCPSSIPSPIPQNNTSGTRLVRGANGPTSTSPPGVVNDGDCPTQLPNLPNHPPGPGIEILGSGSAYGGPLPLLCPQNGEWRSVQGTCSATGHGSRDEDYCGRGGNSGQFGGCCARKCYIGTSGCTTKCVRIGYNADQTACCLANGAPTIGNLTCDPQYRSLSGEACRNVLRTYCDNATHFFEPVCKEYLGNLNEQLKNELGNKYCANSTDPWCACFTAKVPPEWENDPVKKALLRCLDPTCEGGNNPQAMKPYGLTCPTTFVDCQQEDIKLKLIDSGIDRATVEQKCGNINIGGGGGGGGSPPPAPAPAPAPAPSSGLSKGAKYGIVGGSAGVLLLIIIVIILLAAGKKKKGAKGV